MSKPVQYYLRTIQGFRAEAANLDAAMVTLIDVYITDQLGCCVSKLPTSGIHTHFRSFHAHASGPRSERTDTATHQALKELFCFFLANLLPFPPSVPTSAKLDPIQPNSDIARLFFAFTTHFASILPSLNGECIDWNAVQCIDKNRTQQTLTLSEPRPKSGVQSRGSSLPRLAHTAFSTNTFPQTASAEAAKPLANRIQIRFPGIKERGNLIAALDTAIATQERTAREYRVTTDALYTAKLKQALTFSAGNASVTLQDLDMRLETFRASSSRDDLKPAARKAYIVISHVNTLDTLPHFEDFLQGFIKSSDKDPTIDQSVLADMRSYYTAGAIQAINLLKTHPSVPDPIKIEAQRAQEKLLALGLVLNKAYFENRVEPVRESSASRQTLLNEKYFDLSTLGTVKRSLKTSAHKVASAMIRSTRRDGAAAAAETVVPE